MNTIKDYSFETFLLEISAPLNDYLEDTHTDIQSTLHFATQFADVSHATKLYSGWKTRWVEDSFNEDILYKTGGLTEDFLMNMNNLTCLCGACYGGQFEEHKKEVVALLKEYIEQIFSLWNKNGFDRALAENKIIDFTNDYHQIYKNLNETTVDLKKADESLLYWKDAVPDSLLYNSLVSLRYLAIMRHINF
jgi:hypothetical protein